LENISAILKKFPGISLEEMNEFRLLNRADTKYIFSTNKLADVLEDATGSYKLLAINDLNIIKYRTLYFDMPNLRLYHDHHNGLRSRYKVRFREYSDTGQVFLEVKEKNNRDKTIKERMLVEQIETRLSDQSVDFIEKYAKLDARQLVPTIWTKFSRLTLVNEQFRQRITIDLNISFESKSEIKELPFLIICEVKQDRNVGQNFFDSILKSHRIYPQNMSKYGIGTALLNPDIKQNRFKEKILTLNKIRNDSGYSSVAS